METPNSMQYLLLYNSKATTHTMGAEQLQEFAIRAYYHRKYREKKHMFIKNDYAFFTQIEVFCFVHIYQILRPTDTLPWFAQVAFLYPPPFPHGRQCSQNSRTILADGMIWCKYSAFPTLKQQLKAKIPKWGVTPCPLLK